jgi:type II secretory pathway component PulM
MSDTLSRIWGERPERERAVIVLALILLALALAYVYAWLPVTRERDRLLVRVPELRTAAVAMEREARELEKVRVGAPASAGMRAAIQNTSVASGLPEAALEIVQQDPTKVRVSVGSARSEQAIAWVARLHSIAGMRIEHIRLTSFGDGDRVRVQAVLISAR